MNANIPTVRENTSPALTGINPFEIFADTTVGYDAELIKFTKHGIWSIGKDNAPVDVADRFVAVLPALKHGFVKWEDGKPTARRMVLVADHPLAPARNALGDLDPEEWPNGRDGQPADPWTPTLELPLVDRETKAPRLYATSSDGGRQALGKLARAFAQHAKKRPGELPVVALGSETYRHKAYGLVPKPTLLVFDWIPDPDWLPPEASAGPGSYAAELNDEIPF